MKNIAKFILILFATTGNKQLVAQATPGASYPGLVITQLGQVSNVPLSYGGLAFKYNDDNLFLIGGRANQNTSQIFSSTVARDAQCHISGFGTASFFANSSDPLSLGGIDGGMAYENNTNVLFFTTFPRAYICELKPGSTVPDKNISLWGLPGYSATSTQSTGSLTFVPPGFPGAGRLKIGNFTSSGQFFDALITPDGTGTYDISIQGSVDLGYDIEGMAYVKGGCSSYFANNALLVCDYSQGNIFAYDIDASGNTVSPVPGHQLL